DIAFWGNSIIKEKTLEIPHPRVHLRNFALVPLMELNSQLIHPIFKKTIEELYDECSDDSELVMLQNE
ncbi:MAG: 2-amino-4-hydroxy-6-hydroxymethyldihydropteridine diphosphokinase, partial [Saprospiraceae bacterium]